MGPNSYPSLFIQITLLSLNHLGSFAIALHGVGGLRLPKVLKNMV
jgi:hypothetical protein